MALKRMPCRAGAGRHCRHWPLGAAALLLSCLGVAHAEVHLRREGLNLNVFVRQDAVAAHLVLRGGSEPRLMTVFPAGNSGVAVWFEPVPRAFDWALAAPVQPISQPDAHGRTLHGVRFRVRANVSALTFRRAVLSSVRVLRDYQSLGRVPAAVEARPVAAGSGLRWARDRLDGAPGYWLELQVLEGRLRDGRIVAGPAGAITLEVTAASGEPPLTPLAGAELLQRPVQDDKAARAALTFLSYREKFLAGSWRFDTYFGRDTLLSVRLLLPALAPAAVETGLRSVLERLSAQGEVAHEEDIGEFAILDHRRIDGSLSAAPVYDYKMIDTDLLLAPLAQAWWLDDARGRSRAAAFLAAPLAEGMAGEALMRNIRHVLREAAPFAREPSFAHLLALKAGMAVGQWRDSEDGLGGGRYPYDVNAVLMPAALRAIQALERSGLLAPYLTAEDRAAFADLPRLIAVWQQQVRPLFLVGLTDREARAGIIAHAAARGVPAGPALHALAAEGGMRFYALALDAQGRPVPVQHSDVGFALLFDDPPPDELILIADTLGRPFPAGLLTPAGLLVANAAWAPAPMAARFGPGAYHGEVVWSWQQALAAAGFARQLARPDLPAAIRHRLGQAQACLWQAIRAGTDMRGSELWSWRYGDGHYRIAPFGTGGADADEANAAQLWSTVYLAIAPPSGAPACP